MRAYPHHLDVEGRGALGGLAGLVLHDDLEAGRRDSRRELGAVASPTSGPKKELPMGAHYTR